MRRYMMLCETSPAWLMDDLYHGTARRWLDFSPTRVAYFTRDLRLAWQLADMDSEVEGGTPRVFRVKLGVPNPVRMDHTLMQDLHMHEHNALVARLRAEGYNCAIGDGEYDGGEVCVLSRNDIHVQEIINKPDTVQEMSKP